MSWSIGGTIIARLGTNVSHFFATLLESAPASLVLPSSPGPLTFFSAATSEAKRSLRVLALGLRDRRLRWGFVAIIVSVLDREGFGRGLDIVSVVGKKKNHVLAVWQLVVAVSKVLPPIGEVVVIVPHGIATGSAAAGKFPIVGPPPVVGALVLANLTITGLVKSDPILRSGVAILQFDLDVAFTAPIVTTFFRLQDKSAVIHIGDQ